MSPSKAPDLTQAQNWTPKTLSLAVIKTLTAQKARDVHGILSLENAELNDFLKATGKVKKITFENLTHYIFLSWLLKTRTEEELSAILSAFYMRLELEIHAAKQRKMMQIDSEKWAAIINVWYDGRKKSIYAKLQKALRHTLSEHKKAA